MRPFIMLALLFPFLAYAQESNQHHRTHTQMFLVTSIDTLDDAIFWARIYRDRDAAGLLPPDQKASYDAIRAQHAADGTCPFSANLKPVTFCIIAWVGQMRTAYPVAEFPEYNVAYDHIIIANKYDIYATKYIDRVKAYQTAMLAGDPLPDIRTILHSSGMNGNFESGIYGFIQVEAIIALAIRDDSPNLATIKRVLLLNRTASGNLTWALWHHYDGTFDEVYNDMEFRCLGVGNPC